MLLNGFTEKAKADFRKALGLETDHVQPTWPLPNLKPSTEKEFWGWRSSYSWKGEAWIGSVPINGEYATVILYFVGHSSFIGGGFAVAYFHRYREERVEYFEWCACEHQFSEKNIGNCLNRYTCAKCGEAYDVDSSG